MQCSTNHTARKKRERAGLAVRPPSKLTQNSFYDRREPLRIGIRTAAISLGWTRSYPDCPAEASRIVRTASASRTPDDVRLEVLRRTGVIGVPIDTRIVVIYRLYSQRVTVRAETVINSRGPLPLQTGGVAARGNVTAPGNIPESARYVGGNHVCVT